MTKGDRGSPKATRDRAGDSDESLPGVIDVPLLEEGIDPGDDPSHFVRLIYRLLPSAP